ncbi:Ig-like domain repeat protein [Nocardioides sp.]|uniref:Ig-like domain repeat protein n=1 Tax=Nocardioides sp. TaxID=35761 RepID=UPI0031FE81FB|nr:hypothetical protein [Nocardioides sp.]
MSISQVHSRLAVAGAATALVAGVMVAGTAGSADASGTTPKLGLGGGTTFSCAVPLLGSIDLPLVAGIPSLPASLPTELPLAGLPVDVTSLVPGSLLGPLSLLGLGDLGGSINTFSMLLGGLPLSVDDLSALPVTIPGLGALPLAATGVMAPGTAKLGAPGVYDLALPASFNFLPLSSLPLPIALPELGLPCSIKDPSTAVVGQVTVRKQTSSLTTLAASRTITKGAAAKVATKVTRELGGKGAGDVRVYDNGKRISSKSLNNGNARFALRHLNVGKHTLTFKYVGNAKTAGATKNVTIRVVR